MTKPHDTKQDPEEVSLSISNAVIRDLQHYAADAGKTVSQVAEEIIKAYLEEQAQANVNR